MERSIDILNELREISPIVADAGNSNVFTVPQGYFESITGTVMTCIKNETPAGIDVPAGYFDGLSHTILAKIEGTVANELQEISPLLAGIKKVNPFEVPENYFDNIPAELGAQVEEDKVPAILQTANRLQPFEVPFGYFEQLADNILNKVKEESGAKVIAMPKRRNAILKYAAAAIFTGAIALGVYKYTGTPPVSNDTDDLAKNETKFNETLNNLGEEDIIKYLEKNGSEEDVAALSSGIDESSLPDQEEYFTDDATLDKFLEDIDSKN